MTRTCKTRAIYCSIIIKIDYMFWTGHLSVLFCLFRQEQMSNSPWKIQRQQEPAGGHQFSWTVSFMSLSFWFHVVKKSENPHSKSKTYESDLGWFRCFHSIQRRLSLQLPILHHAYLPSIGGVDSSPLNSSFDIPQQNSMPKTGGLLVPRPWWDTTVYVLYAHSCVAICGQSQISVIFNLVEMYCCEKCIRQLRSDSILICLTGLVLVLGSDWISVS